MDDCEQGEQRRQNEQTGFGSGGTTRQQRRAVNGGGQQASWGFTSAIVKPKYKALAEIPRGVKAEREPERARLQQAVRQRQTKQPGSDDAKYRLAFVSDMPVHEPCTAQNGGRPKRNRTANLYEGIAAMQTFLTCCLSEPQYRRNH